MGIHMTRYDVLYECYYSGQMNDRELHEHMSQDAVFAAFVKRKDEIRLNKGKR